MARAAARLALPAVFVVALFALGSSALSAPPYQPSDAEKQAKYACLAQDVKPGSPVWELCLSHVTRAYEWDEPALALQLAHAAGKARSTCREDGLLPSTSDYTVCVDHEIQAQSQLLVLGDDDSGTNLAETPH